MILQWPTDLPSRPDQPSWQLAPQTARVATRSDAGPVIYRRRSSAVVRLVRMSFQLDRNQRAIFDEFYHKDCLEGSLLFRFPDPTTDGWTLLASDGTPLLDDEGQTVQASAVWLCAWGEQPPVETIEPTMMFRKSFTLQVLP